VALLVPSLGWQCFFNEPVMLLGFVLLGRFIEERARFRTGRALEQLAALQPDTALLVLGDGPPRPVRVGGLRPEDRVLLLPGDRVPVDGLVLEGRSAVDASSLTGEPLPLQAGPGSELAAGSLNLEAPLTLQVLRSGSDSAVARIIATSQRRNPAWGITGLLVFGSGIFFQWLEGPREQVLKLMALLKTDSRHDNVVPLSESEEVRERMFPDWAMELVTADHIREVLVDALESATDAGHAEALTRLLAQLEGGPLQDLASRSPLA
jgi:magnesium-transporting ATPase (P-type)